jgi:hypothetical protein
VPLSGQRQLWWFVMHVSRSPALTLPTGSCAILAKGLPLGAPGPMVQGGSHGRGMSCVGTLLCSRLPYVSRPSLARSLLSYQPSGLVC